MHRPDALETPQAIDRCRDAGDAAYLRPAPAACTCCCPARQLQLWTRCVCPWCCYSSCSQPRRVSFHLTPMARAPAFPAVSPAHLLAGPVVATATGNTWVENRACGGAPGECRIFPDNENNFCPESAPVDELGYVWCDCQNEHGHVRMSATKGECERTEGLTDEQEVAYEALGINTVDYDCQCCTCQSLVHGVPQVGEPGKSCNEGSVDPDNTGCNDSVYYMFAAAIVVACFAVVFTKLKDKHEKDLQGTDPTATGGGSSSKKDLKKSLSSDQNYKANPL